MTRPFRLLLATPLTLALLPAVSAQAQSQPSSQPSDIKCLMLSNAYAKQATEEKSRAIALQASFFYLGRVTGPAADVQARLAEEARKLTSDDNGDAMAACANAMVRRAEELSTETEPRPNAPQGR